MFVHLLTGLNCGNGPRGFIVLSFPMFVLLELFTVGSHFATVRFMRIHFYDPCGVGLSTRVLWYITVATQASFLYLACFYLLSGVHVFLLFLF